jgi:hypothetical protein
MNDRDRSGDFWPPYMFDLKKRESGAMAVASDRVAMLHRLFRFCFGSFGFAKPSGVLPHLPDL